MSMPGLKWTFCEVQNTHYRKWVTGTHVVWGQKILPRLWWGFWVSACELLLLAERVGRENIRNTTRGTAESYKWRPCHEAYVVVRGQEARSGFSPTQAIKLNSKSFCILSHHASLIRCNHLHIYNIHVIKRLGMMLYIWYSSICEAEARESGYRERGL